MTPRELIIVARNVVRVLRDSTRLDDLLVVGEILSRPAMERAVAALAATPAGARLFEERPELNSSRVDFDALRASPPGTLGRVFIDHMDRYGLSADALNVPRPQPGDPDATYLLRRYRGNHDLWHALLGLGTDGWEEVLVQAFSFGQLRQPQAALIILFGGVKHLVLEGRWEALRRDLVATWRAGRDAAPLLAVRWEDHWGEPIEAVRARFGLPEVGLRSSARPEAQGMAA